MRVLLVVRWSCRQISYCGVFLIEFDFFSARNLKGKHKKVQNSPHTINFDSRKSELGNISHAQMRTLSHYPPLTDRT